MSANDAATLIRSASATPASVRDVPEPAAAEILPELVAADLIDEVDVEQAVAVDVGDGDAVAVIVVHRLVVHAGVVDDAVDERDAAFLDAIGELEIVDDLERSTVASRAAPSRRERIDADIRIGNEHLLRCRYRGRTGRPAPADEHRDERERHEQEP